MSLVLDCPVTLAWNFEDEGDEATASVLDSVVERGAVAPALYRLEVANALKAALRRKRIDAAFRDASLMDHTALPVAIDSDADSHV